MHAEIKIHEMKFNLFGIYIKFHCYKLVATQYLEYIIHLYALHRRLTWGYLMNYTYM